ncbi:MAG: response regulator [Sphingobacteriaceae bacterium]
MNIVVIEDDESIRENLQEILEAHQFNVKSFPDGLLGLKGIQENIPDLVICDIMVPQLNGYEVLHALKSKEETATIPFIFLTAKVESADQRKGMAMGADDYIFKPFTSQDLLNAIKIRVEKQKITKAKIQKELHHKLRAFAKINSHEYNTPLNGILGLAEVLKNSDQQLSAAEIQEVGQAIYTSGKRLHRTFKNFILYILIQEDGLKSEIADFISLQLKECLQAKLTEIAFKFNRLDDIKLQFDLSYDRSFTLPEEDLCYVMEELFRNALKFSKKGSPVAATMKVYKTGFSIEISNATHDANFFANAEPFKQFNRELNEQQGSGLGLYLCKRMAQIHGWELTNSQKKGTTSMLLKINA